YRGLDVMHDREHLDAIGRAQRHAHELGEEPLVVDDDDADGLGVCPQRAPLERTWVASAATTAASSSPRATALCTMRMAACSETDGRSARCARRASNRSASLTIRTSKGICSARSPSG